MLLKSLVLLTCKCMLLYRTISGPSDAQGAVQVYICVLQEALNYDAITVPTIFVHIMPPPSIAKYSFIQLRELGQRGVEQIDKFIELQQEDSN